MAEHPIVRAPYNFVPFSSKVLPRYQSEDELPRHDRLDPALKTGEIHVTMTADTPVFVSDGKKPSEFFRAPNGKYALPGSTIRGMVRENMQILGFGLVRPGEDFEDIQILFREMAAARGSTGDVLKEHYQAALGIKSVRNSTGKPVSVPQNVQAGYLRKSGAGYYIQPVKGTYLRVSRSHPDVACLGDANARCVPVAYTARGDRVEHLQADFGSASGMERGMLLFTGKPVGSKPNHLYLFPEPDEGAASVEISDQDVLSYKEDWESRRNSLKAYDPNFWALPNDGEEKAVFYVHYEGHVYFGMSLFLRVGHKHALSEGLPKRHSDLIAEESAPLDYPRAMLGYAEQNRSYKSRVSFGDFEAVDSPRNLNTYRTVLGQPKPSYYPGYVVGGNSYSDDDFQLRGYKQYWLKDVGAMTEGKDSVKSELRPLPEGTRFRGVIRFQNLHEDELGLLLWCLRLDSGCFQSIGMGKPCGFGRMKLHIDALLEYDPARLYSTDGLCGDFAEDRTGAVDGYIDAYDAYAAKELYIKKPKKKPSVRSLNEIKDFFYMCSSLKTEEVAGYMALEEYKNVRAPLPDTASFREKEEGQSAGGKSGPETPDGGKSGSPQPSMDDMLAQLAAKYKRH